MMILQTDARGNISYILGDTWPDFSEEEYKQNEKRNQQVLKKAKRLRRLADKDDARRKAAGEMTCYEDWEAKMKEKGYLGGTENLPTKRKKPFISLFFGFMKKIFRCCHL